MIYCHPVCQITQIFSAVQERQLEVTERHSGPFRLNLTIRLLDPVILMYN